MVPTECQDGDLTSDGAATEENEDTSLNRTGKLFGGLVADIRRKAPWYVSDFKDGIHRQCLASALFMYFGCLVPMVMFGGLLGTVTDNNIAALECLVSGAICGVTYHLFCGQPLTIISSTGPVLVFETIVYGFCRQFDWYYLGFRFWIGIWICLIFLVFVAFDLSFLVRYITRFTEESFATLVAVTFIFEATTKQLQQPFFWQESRKLDDSCLCIIRPVSEVDHTEVDHTEVDHTWQNLHYEDVTLASDVTRSELDQNSTAGDCLRWSGVLLGDGCLDQYSKFFSLFLFFGTFLLSLLLKQFGKARFLPFLVRSCISDFAVVATVFVMVIIDAALGMRTTKLHVPETFRPTRPDRNWIVDPFGSGHNPWYTVIAAFPLGVFAAILMFMDQHIPTVIITRKDKKLKKGSGFHLDLLVIALQIAVCSAFGTPWFVGATILSINHVNSLIVETETSAPGQRPLFLGIREQRVTGILVFLLVGLSVFIAQVLKFVPMSVLYGIFLYMGLTTFQGMQLVDRLMLLVMGKCCRPKGNSVLLVQLVGMSRIRLFTIIQFFCILALLVIKEIQIVSILFPLLVVATCVVRKALDVVFTYEELLYLDDILPGSQRSPPIRNGPTADNTATTAMELQAEGASCMIPMAPNDVTESRGVSDGDLRDAVAPPDYNAIIQHSDGVDDPQPPAYDAIARLEDTVDGAI